MMAFLNKGLEIRFKDERPEHKAEPVTYRYSGGIVDFVKHLNTSKEALFTKVGYFEQAEDDGEVEVAFQWNTGYNADGIHSFANGINTIEGGTHEEGFKAALTTVVNKHARAKNLLKEKDPNLQGEDIREGITAIISVRLRDPQFEGQTKAKLGNTSIKTLVQKATNDQLGEWFEENPTEANKIVKKAIAAAQARVAAKKARDVIRNKTLLDGAGMPDKLKDCSSKNREERELFIVEGDSAGGSAVTARDPLTPGDPPDPRQDPQRRAGPPRQDAEEPSRSRRSSPPSAPASARSSTSRSAATTRSASWPTPTSTASTSARCCSRSSSGR